MTKIPNFRIKVKFEDRTVIDQKADRIEEYDDLFKDLRRKFK